MQTFSKVIAAFNDKHNAALKSRKYCGGLRCEASYRRIVFSVIDDLSRVKSSKCIPSQRSLMIDALTILCRDDSPDSLLDIKARSRHLQTFLKDSFNTFLTDSENARKNNNNLKKLCNIFELLCLNCVDFFIDAIFKRRFVEKILDLITTFPIVRLHQNSEGPAADLKFIHEKVLRSQIAYELSAILSSKLSSLTETLGLVPDKADIYSRLSLHIKRLSTVNTALFEWRNEVKSVVGLKFCTLKHDEVFQESALISTMVRFCDLDDYIQCSHVLKIFVIFGENLRLCHIIIKKFASEFTDIFLATIRAQEASAEEILAKFWLVQKVCNNANYCALIFLTEGGVLQILSMLRSVNMEAAASLKILAPFCRQATFLDMSLTNAQLIQQFSYLLLSDRCGKFCRHAFTVLKTFADGLQLPSPHSSRIANSFIESDILFGLVNAIGSDNRNEQDSLREMGTSLLCMLVANSTIREAFLVEPLSILHCLATSPDQLACKSRITSSLIAVLEVIVNDKVSHMQLLERNMAKSLAIFIINILSVSDEGYVLPGDSKVDIILRCLNIFGKMAFSRESRQLFSRTNFSDFLHVLLLHDNHIVVNAVVALLNKLESHPSPKTWKKLFQMAKFFD